MKIGGVDPAVIRELSGIYKPFVKASKELISNAYDADAELVKIRLSDDYLSLEIHDDGRGLTPDEFRTDFTKIGGSYTRIREEFTSKQRPKIGSKGIGFLAVARYSSKMDIHSTTTRSHHAKVLCPVRRKKADLITHLETPVPRELLIPRISIQKITPVSERARKPLAQRHNHLGPDGVINLSALTQASEWDAVEVEYSVDCSDLELRATIDFEYLLSLENKRNLEEIEDFCTVEVCEFPENDGRINQHYTRITLHELKDFVVRDLVGARKHGNVKNVESRSGIDRFVWHLRRCIPVRYELPTMIQEKFGKGNLQSSDIKSIGKVIFSGPGYDEVELTRPVWPEDPNATLCLDNDISVEVNIDSGGLIAKGYILGHTEIIYPAEYRGIAIRVRNVQIGAPNFLGFENIATGFVKAALSQITGEINILHGADAIDALNPGRESFYEENSHFKLLRKHIVGDKEAIGGLLGQLVSNIWKRTQVVSAVNDQIMRANQRRKALLSLSMAITYYSRGAGAGEGLRQLFRETANLSNGLARLPATETGPAKTLQGFHVENRHGLEEDQLTDFVNKKVYLDFTHDRWSWRISLLGNSYEVIPVEGGEKDPICQLDTVHNKVYVNWGHPLRQQMGDAPFIKSAVAWKVAFHASQGRIENMMDLALKMLTHVES